MSDGGSSGGFDSGPTGGGTFDSGFGGGLDNGAATVDSGLGGGSDAYAPSDPAQGMGGTGFDSTCGPGSPLWMHQQHLHHNAQLHFVPRRSAVSLPTGPVGIVLLVIFAIIALVVFANFSSGAENLYPGTPTGELIDGGTSDGGSDVPPVP